MFIDRQMNKQWWYTHTIKYYLATEKNEVLIHANHGPLKHCDKREVSHEGPHTL